MLGLKELSTLVNLTLLKDLPISADKDEINFLCHTASIAIQDLRRGPPVCKPQPSGLSKVMLLVP